jgi:hypothetical protein
MLHNFNKVQIDFVRFSRKFDNGGSVLELQNNGNGIYWKRVTAFLLWYNLAPLLSRQLT